MAAFLHYIYLVVFCLMLAWGIEMVILVVYVFPAASRVWKLTAVAWGKSVMQGFARETLHLSPERVITS